MKKLTRKQVNEFEKEAIEIIEFYNVKKNSENDFYSNYPHYTESDKIGKLYIKIDTEISSCYTIFTRYENFEKASQHFNLGMNPKNNCHTYNMDEALFFIDELLNNYNIINGIDYHVRLNEA